MPVFTYRATTFEGSIVEGVIDAPDEQTAAERLKNSGVIPLKVLSAEKGRKRPFAITFRTGRQKDQILTFTTELSALLGAGLPLDRSLNILAEISADREMKRIITEVLRSIREGGSFSDALQKHPSIFSTIYVNMVRAGEAGGVLGDVLEQLNEFLESAKELKESVVSAMIYPSILVLTGGMSIIFLMTYILPQFSVIFDELGGSLPLATKVLLAVSSFLSSYWWLFLLAVAGFAMGFRIYVRTEQGRFMRDRAMLRLTGELIRKLETARFARTLGTLIRSGVPMLQALVNAKDVISNRVVAQSIDSVMKGAREGRGIAVPLAQAGTLPQLALSMIKVGEETGQLDIMLLKVAQTYEKSLRTEIRRFMSVLEPAMILIMGAVIGFIVISMLMAIFSITELPF
ncbi:MAG: type II secretion system protein GspF [Nitrospirae bacterium]|nr:type II secretion system protein GspF [Nitrospirota bacterium]